MKKGFTLVELSVVLVIIGVLIGGILVARSMMSTSKVQTVIKEVQQYDAMVANFKSQYEGLPGDTVEFNASANGDGIISGCSGSLNNWSGCNEINHFWIDLAAAGLGPPGVSFTTTLSGAGLSSQGNVINVPHLSYSNNAQIIACSGSIPYYVNPNIAIADPALWLPRKNHFYIGNNTVTDNLSQYQTPSAAAIIPADAAAIDIKIDDGVPSTGIVISSTGDGSAVMFQDEGEGKFDYAVLHENDEKPKPVLARVLPQFPNSSKCVTYPIGGGASKYDLTQTTPQCTLSILMFSQSGTKSN